MSSDAQTIQQIGLPIRNFPPDRWENLDISNYVALPAIAAARENQQLLSYLDAGSIDRSGVVLMDFSGCALINAIISLNPGQLLTAPRGQSRITVISVLSMSAVARKRPM